MGINLIIVGHVILMIGAGVKDWIQVDSRNAEIGQIIQMRLDTRQITTIEDHRRMKIRLRFGSPGICFGVLTSIFELGRLWVVVWVAIGKPVGEYLVKDRRGQPLHRLITGQDAKICHVKGDLGRNAGP